ncbi:MAG: hypothetical protein KY466_14660 [Gemmatimonadetes bacterium]|nr:hypothetical protein [Gemmatimonadota bacterium]
MSKRLQVVLDGEEYAEIGRAAEEARLTVSAWVRQALREARAAAGRAGVREAGPAYAGEPDRAVSVRVGLTPALHGKLRDRAQREHRSVAGEAAYLLERALADAESLSLLELEGLGAPLWEGEDAAAHVARERDAWD